MVRPSNAGAKRAVPQLVIDRALALTPFLQHFVIFFFRFRRRQAVDDCELMAILRRRIQTPLVAQWLNNLDNR